MNGDSPEGESLRTKEKELTRWLVTVEVIRKFEIDVLAENKGEAIEQAIEMTESEPSVDSYVNEAHARPFP